MSIALIEESQSAPSKSRFKSLHRSLREGVGRDLVTLRGARVFTVDRDQTRIADDGLFDEARIGTGQVLNGNRIGVPLWEIELDVGIVLL